MGKGPSTDTIALEDKIGRARARGATIQELSGSLNITPQKVTKLHQHFLRRMANVSHDIDVGTRLQAELDQVIAQAWEDHDHAASDDGKVKFLNTIADLLALKAKTYGYDSNEGPKTLVINTMADILPMLQAAQA